MRQRIVENFSIRAEDAIPLNKLDESFKFLEVKGRMVKCIAAFTFPVSRPGEINLNERIYPHRLWERVFERRQGEGRMGLCDHASETSDQPGGSVKDAFCVWRNLRFNEDRTLVLADCYLFGQWGQHMKDALDATAEPGFSTVGFGDFLDDGKTIDPETYDLDHPADWVLDPSYQVFGNLEDEIKVEGEIVRIAPIVREALNEKGEPRMSTPLEKTQEKALRRQIEGMVKNASEKTNPIEKMKALEDAKEFLSDGAFPELLETVETQRVSTQKEIDTLAEKGLTVESQEQKIVALEEGAGPLNEKIKSLETQIATLVGEKAVFEASQEKLLVRYEKACDLADSLKAFAEKLQEMYNLKVAEVETRVTAEEFLTAQAYVEQLNLEVKTLNETLNKLKKENEALTKKNEAYFLGRGKSQTRTNISTREDITVTDPPAEPTTGDLPPGPPEGETNDDLAPEILAMASPVVAAYYADMVQMNPKVIKIREEILKCRTITEAQRTYLRLKGLVETERTFHHTREVKPLQVYHRDAPAGNFPMIEENETSLPRRSWEN